MPDMALQTRNVRHPTSGKLTSIRLAPAFWSAIGDIQRREEITRDQVIARSWRARSDGGLSEAVRSYCVGYYRRALAACEAKLKGHRP